MTVSQVRRSIAVTLTSLGLFMGLGVLGPSAQPATETVPLVYSAEFDGIIQPVSAEYLMQVLDRADRDKAAVVILTLRTPGGVLESTRRITTHMLSAQTPVVVFVAPRGARAASAGFLITIAADIAAMAPGTHIGAAHPVSASGQSVDETMAKKAASDVAAYARTLATERGRNVDLAERAVLESEAFTAEEAHKASPPLVDLIAADLDDLLAQLDGRTVRRADGREIVVETKNARVESIQMTWRQDVLSAIAHPQVALLLFSLGTLGLTIELWNPGAILPGIVGGLCLLLAFFAFQVLPVNYAGLLLILFGLLLLVLEVTVTSFGLLAVGGIVSMIFGAMILVDSSLPEMQLGLPFVFATMFALSSIVLFLVKLAVNSQRRQPVTGMRGMAHQVGRALTPIEQGGTGRITTLGEIWAATATEPIREGDAVQITAVDGLTVTVRHLSSAESRG